MLTRKCDICEKEADNHYIELGTIHHLDYINGKIKKLGTHFEVCPECFEKIEKIVWNKKKTD